jgi:hypothetical protein
MYRLRWAAPRSLQGGANPQATNLVGDPSVSGSTADKKAFPNAPAFTFALGDYRTRAFFNEDWSFDKTT